MAGARPEREEEAGCEGKRRPGVKGTGENIFANCVEFGCWAGRASVAGIGCSGSDLIQISASTCACSKLCI